jgi:hypothetical protein
MTNFHPNCYLSIRDNSPEGSFLRGIGTSFAPGRHLEHRHHCCVGSNTPRRRELA